jgi:site-specific DNA recombinase
VDRIARPSSLDHQHASRTPGHHRGERSPAKAKRSQHATHNHIAPDLASFTAAVPDTTGTPLVVRSFASQITIFDGAVITIQRVRQHRGERHGRRETRRDVAPEQWTSIPVPALITEETFELAQARLQENKHYAKRNSREPALLKGILVCRDCGYACWRTSARTTKRVIYYYRCIGSDNYRFVGGRVCANRPIRADELDALVWGAVERLLSDPTLIRAEIERRLTALRTESPAAHRREGLERELVRVKAASARLIEAYQEQLITLDELRARMPTLRKRQTTLTAQLDALDAELHDAETYLQLAENLEGFLARLAENAQNLTVKERQRIVQLVVREVLIGDDGITIRHTIPTPTGPDDPSYLLRGSSHHTALRGSGVAARDRPVLHHSCAQHRAQQLQDLSVDDPFLDRGHQLRVWNRLETVGDIRLQHPPPAAPRLINENLERIALRAPGPEPERALEHVSLEDRLNDDPRCCLNDPVTNSRNRERSQLITSGLRYEHPARGQRPPPPLPQIRGQLIEEL